VIHCPDNVSVSTGVGRATCDQVATWSAATATDNCTASGSIGIKYYINYVDAGNPGTEVHSGDTFPVGTTTVTAEATDGAGNKNTCTFTVTVADNTPPVVHCPANVSVSTGVG